MDETVVSFVPVMGTMMILLVVNKTLEEKITKSIVLGIITASKSKLL